MTIYNPEARIAKIQEPREKSAKPKVAEPAGKSVSVQDATAPKGPTDSVVTEGEALPESDEIREFPNPAGDDSAGDDPVGDDRNPSKPDPRLEP